MSGRQLGPGCKKYPDPVRGGGVVLCVSPYVCLRLRYGMSTALKLD